MQNRSRGFTLTELLVALAVAALILGIAAPGFNDFRRNNRLTAAANDFLSAAQVARTEAIKRQVPVAVCPSGDPQNLAATCTAGAFSGWIVFVDTNNDCQRAAGEEKLKGDGPVDNSVRTRSNGNCVSFAGTGFIQAIAGRPSATRTVYCDTRGLANIAGQNQSAGRGIFVMNTGRSRVSRDSTSRTLTDVTQWGLACP
jgi:type IV fimbrial biogenesis protein FimT